MLLSTDADADADANADTNAVAEERMYTYCYCQRVVKSQSGMSIAVSVQQETGVVLSAGRHGCTYYLLIR